MENDILDSLEDLGYCGPLIEDNVLLQCVQGDAVNFEYMDLCKWLIDDIQEFTGVIENITVVDEQEFCIEISGFLREYGCPYSDLTGATGLTTTHNRLLLLGFLISELQACRMLGKNDDTMDVDQREGTPAYCHVSAILAALDLPAPTDQSAVFDVLSNIENKVNECIRKGPKGHLGEPLLTKRLNPAQWAQVNKINNTLTREYSLRRQMLLTRLDVTVQSFRWSELGKKKQDSISGDFQPIRSVLEIQAPVTLADVLAARTDLTKVVKTSSEDLREKTKCAINRVLIGKVPFRGGKPSAKGPPPDMPQFSKREAPKGQRQKGGHGGRGGYDSEGGRGGYDGGGRGAKGRRGRERVQRGHNASPQGGRGSGGYVQRQQGGSDGSPFDNMSGGHYQHDYRS